MGAGNDLGIRNVLLGNAEDLFEAFATFSAGECWTVPGAGGGDSQRDDRNVGT
jgi:hypothetical protein